jgi:hypothetical protein
LPEVAAVVQRADRQLRVEQSVVQSRWRRAFGHEPECVTGRTNQRTGNEADDCDEGRKPVLQEWVEAILAITVANPDTQ